MNFLQQKYFPENFDFRGTLALMFSKQLSFLLQQNNTFQEFPFKLATQSRFPHFLFQWPRGASWYFRRNTSLEFRFGFYSQLINTLGDHKLVASPLWVSVPSKNIKELKSVSSLILRIRIEDEKESGFQKDSLSLFSLADCFSGFSFAFCPKNHDLRVRRRNDIFNEDHLQWSVNIMKAFSGISAECYMRFALYSKMIMVRVIRKNIMYHLRHMS